MKEEAADARLVALAFRRDTSRKPTGGQVDSTIFSDKETGERKGRVTNTGNQKGRYPSKPAFCNTAMRSWSASAFLVMALVGRACCLMFHLEPNRSGHYLNFFLFPLCENSLICLEGKPMTLIGETLFSVVPPSNSLVSVSDPWLFELTRSPLRALNSPHSLLPEL